MNAGDQQVNIPLLRKAVEWAEAEAAKPEGCLWVQAWWTLPPDTDSEYEQMLRARNGLTAECGTAYCIAGYVQHLTGGEGIAAYDAAAALGITYNPFDPHPGHGDRLFSAMNTIEDVRRIAEEIAGERL